MLKQILFGGESGLSFIGNAGIALLRIFAGVSLSLAHGFGKVPVKHSLSKTRQISDFPLPAFFAWAAATFRICGRRVSRARTFYASFPGLLIAVTMSSPLSVSI